MGLSYKDALKLSSSQVNEFALQGCFEINKYINGRVHPMKVSWYNWSHKYLSERVHHMMVSIIKVHKWTDT